MVEVSLAFYAAVNNLVADDMSRLSIPLALTFSMST